MREEMQRQMRQEREHERRGHGREREAERERQRERDAAKGSEGGGADDGSLISDKELQVVATRLTCLSCLSSCTCLCLACLDPVASRVSWRMHTHTLRLPPSLLIIIHPPTPPLIPSLPPFVLVALALPRAWFDMCVGAGGESQVPGFT
jgi:hypothetical protein